MWQNKCDRAGRDRDGGTVEVKPWCIKKHVTPEASRSCCQRNMKNMTYFSLTAVVINYGGYCCYGKTAAITQHNQRHHYYSYVLLLLLQVSDVE